MRSALPPSAYDVVSWGSWDLRDLWGRTLPGGVLLVETANAPLRLPWREVESSCADSHSGSRLAALAQAIRATKRWEGAGPVGVRAWDVGHTGHLLSPLQRGTWRQTMRARCWREGPSTAPGPTCYCGLYAMRPEAAALLLGSDLPSTPAAIGVVSLYGRVLRHRYGWRAEYARIREVWWIAEPDGPTPRTDLYPGVTWHRVEVWR